MHRTESTIASTKSKIFLRIVSQTNCNDLVAPADDGGRIGGCTGGGSSGNDDDVVGIVMSAVVDSFSIMVPFSVSELDIVADLVK